MRTDEYWLEFGGKGPEWNNIREIIDRCIRMRGEGKEEQSGTLIKAFHKALSDNFSKPYIINRTTTNTVKVIMMSGAEYEVPLENVQTRNNLEFNVVKAMEPKRIKEIKIIDGDRLLSSNSSRLILTDETVLTIVVLA